MKTLPILVAIAAFSLAYSLQAQPQRSRNSNSNASGSSAQQEQQKLSQQDQKFVMEAAQGNMAEVRLGEIARDNGRHNAVKDYGKMISSDHSKAGQRLRAIAEKKGIQLSENLTSKQQDTVNKLGKMREAEFDRAYVREMISDHRKNIREYEEAAREVKDSEIKDYVNSTLPALRAHLERAEELQRQVEQQVQ